MTINLIYFKSTGQVKKLNDLHMTHGPYFAQAGTKQRWCGKQCNLSQNWPQGTCDTRTNRPPSLLWIFYSEDGWHWPPISHNGNPRKTECTSSTSFLHSHPTPATSTQAIHVHRLSAGPSNLPGFGGGHGHQGPRRHRSGGHPGHCQPQPHCDQRRRWEQRPTCTISFILLLSLLLLLLMMIIVIIKTANSICLSLVWAAKAVVAPAMTATDPNTCRWSKTPGANPQHLLKPLSPTDASWHTLKPADFCQPIKTPAEACILIYWSLPTYGEHWLAQPKKQNFFDPVEQLWSS